MQIQAIYFDIGGVLVRTTDRAPRAALALRLGMTYEALDDLVFGGENGSRAQRGEITTEQHWAYVCQQVRWPLQDWRALQSEFFAGDLLDVGLVARIREYHKRYKTAIISNAFDDLRAAIDTRWRFADAFDAILVSAELHLMKPDPRIFQIALQTLAVPAAQAIFVDDFAHNVAAAQALGMQAIQFRSTEQALAELDALLEAV